MAKLVTVKAGNNGPVFLPAPIQGVRQIADEPIEVESTRFIRRRIEVGDLMIVTGGMPETAAAEVFTGESAAPVGEVFATTATPRRRAGDKE